MIILEPRKALKPFHKVEWEVLKEDANCQGITFAAGSMFKQFETKNFGWIVFHPSAMSPNGFTPGKRFFKW